MFICSKYIWKIKIMKLMRLNKKIVDSCERQFFEKGNYFKNFLNEGSRNFTRIY